MQSPRILVLAALVAAGALALEARLFWLQVVNGAHYAAQVDQSRVVVEVLAPRRGRILDRTGAPIADTRQVYDLAVVFAELELGGRARRDTVFWRLDERAVDALAADLAARVRPAAAGGEPPSMRALLQAALAAHPAAAERTLRRDHGPPLALLAVPRLALDPRAEADEDLPGAAAQLAEGALLGDDPREALERELLARRALAADILLDGEFHALCAQFDTAFALPPGQAQAVLDAYAPPFTLALAPAGTARLALRLVARDRRAAAVESLARAGDLDPVQVGERLDRLIAGVRAPAAPGPALWAASADAGAIAPRLPRDRTMAEIAVPGVPGARERVWLLQGDPPDGEGAYAWFLRRFAADLGLTPVDLQALVERHARPMRTADCEREFRVRQLALDARRLQRLGDGLAVMLTTLGRPTDRLRADALLAEARHTADRAWHGQTRSDPIALFRDIPHALAVRLMGRDAEPPRDLRKRFDETEAELPGLEITVDVGRAYPFPGSSSHILGDLARDQDDPARPPAGRFGLERTYEERLRGIAGSRVRVRTPEGVQVLREDLPVHGADLVTELDMELQTVAEDSLDRYLDLAEAMGCKTPKMEAGHAVGRGRAGFVLIDCHTGGLLAMASTPGYRLEDLRRNWNGLLKDPGQPLIDHAAVADQPSGSTMKIVTALACLRHGAVNPGEEIECKGYMAMVGGKKVLRDHAPPGTYDLITAIQMSSNVYFSIIGARLGPERLAETAWLLGLGRNNALDVPHQRPGILPTPATLARLRPREPKWLPSDTWRMAIGQFCTASPLQAVCFSAAVANGGYVVRPYLVRPSSQPQAVDLQIRRDWLEQARRGMEKATDHEPRSTARLMVLEGKAAGVKVAAKTGTAEWGSKEFDHAWMIGYAPADNPTVAFACFIHCGTFGGLACTPVAKRVLETYFAKYGHAGHAEAVPAPARAEPPAPAQPAEEEAGG